MSLETYCNLGVVLFCCVGCGHVESTVDTRDALREVHTVAQELAKPYFKSPSSAIFSPYQETRIEILDGNSSFVRYRISWWIEAQNSFGITGRNRYTTIVRKEGEHWRLMSHELDELRLE